MITTRDPVLAIRGNTCGISGACPLCGRGTDPAVPFAIFRAGTWEDVCERCSNWYAPTLVRLLGRYYNAEGRFSATLASGISDADRAYAWDQWERRRGDFCVEVADAADLATENDYAAFENYVERLQADAVHAWERPAHV